MTPPETDRPAEPPRQPAAGTAPPAGPRRWWAAVPHHLGRARTSTVVLVLLFVGLYTLYLYVRPPEVAPAPATGGTTVQTPGTTAPAEPTRTTAPAQTSGPAETDPPETSPPEATESSASTPRPTSATPGPSSPSGPAAPETPARTAGPTPTTAGNDPSGTQAPGT